MTTQSKPAAATIPVPVAPPDPIKAALDAAQPEPDRLKLAMKAKDDAIASEKAANKLLQDAVQRQTAAMEAIQQQNSTMTDEMAALRDLIASQVVEPEPVPAAPGVKPGQVDLQAMFTQQQQQIQEGVHKLLEPYAIRMADISADTDRRMFEKALTSQFGQNYELSDAQHLGTKQMMAEHGKLTYQQAAKLLPGDLELKAPEPIVPTQTTEGVQQTTQTQAPPALPPGATPSTPAQPKPKTYSKQEMIQAANAAKDSGDTQSQEDILFARLQEGTSDPHGEFGPDFFTGKKSGDGNK